MSENIGEISLVKAPARNHFNCVIFNFNKK